MKEDVQLIIDRRATELLQQAMRGEPVGDEQVGELQRLHALSELAAGARAKRGRTWPIPVAAAVTLALVSAMLFAHVPSTEIELDAELSEVTFVVQSRQAILGTQNFDALGAGGLAAVRLPVGGSGAQTVLASAMGELCNAEVSVQEASSPSGAVSLNALVLPAGTAVSVTYQAADRVALLVRPPAAQRVGVELSVRGKVRIVARCPVDSVNEEADYRSPQLVALEGAPAAPLFLQVTLTAGRAIAFASQMGVTDLALYQIDELVDGTRASARKVSSLSSGTLYLESLNGKPVVLRPYEELRFSRSTGVLRRLALSRPAGSNDGGLTLHAQATVEGMTIGTRRNMRSLMPTYLEWLSARQGLALLWGSTLYVTGLLASLLRWLRISW